MPGSTLTDIQNLVTWAQVHVARFDVLPGDYDADLTVEKLIRKRVPVKRPLVRKHNA